jgi:hypothetical protein
MALRAGVFAVLLLSTSAHAVECATIAGAVPELAKIDAHVRLRFLRERIRVEARKTRIWAWTWSGIYSALVVYNLALIDPNDRDNLIDQGVGAGASAVGILSIALAPPKIIGDQYWLERRLRNAPAGEDVCAQLADAERVLAREVKATLFGKGALTHAGNFVFNIGVALLLGFGFNHWDQAAIQGLVGIAVGEVMTLSRPGGIVKDLKRYRAANLGVPPAWREISWGLAPMVGPNRAGLLVGITF